MTERLATLVPSMKDYVEEIPATIRRANDLLPRQVAEIVAAMPVVHRVDLVGSGTSLHAAMAVQGELEQAWGVEVRVLTPSGYLTAPQDRVGAGSLLVGISQTGRSTGTIDAMADARARGAHVILVTGWADAAGGAAADAVLDISCGPEWVGARTKGYVATVFALLRLIDEKARTTAEYADGYAALESQLAEVIDKSKRALPAASDVLEGASSIWVISYGSGMATAREGALKMLETVRVPILAYDVEEYMHGPYHCLEPDTRLVFILPAGEGRVRAARLLEFVQGITEHVVVIDAADAMPAVSPGGQYLATAVSEQRYQVLAQIVLLQLLCVELTWRCGREPGVSRYPDFHDRMASKAPAPSATQVDLEQQTETQEVQDR